ncbi:MULTISPECIES: hypothetical protein [unclassified Streptomyces]|uniref:hypothetical protein n=1 Tax=unclassified Streptomyces TaxID=2593676 RepID=UPI002E260609
MTALASAGTGSPGTRGLSRTVLRVHRTALTVWTVFILAAVGHLVWLTEVTADSVHARIAACSPTQDSCTFSSALGEYTGPLGMTSTFAYYSFWAVAAWAGGALIGRELESGTAHLAWTQGVSPARWLATKLAVPALALVLGDTLFVVVFRWAWAAHRDLMGDDWTFADVFAARGPTLVAYSLCALAVGALTALLLRRALAALAISVAVMIVLNQYLEIQREDRWTRPRFWPMTLMESGILLTLAALATTAAFVVLRRRTV